MESKSIPVTAQFTRRGIEFWFWLNEPKSDFIHNFLIDFEPNGILFGTNNLLIRKQFHKKAPLNVHRNNETRYAIMLNKTIIYYFYLKTACTSLRMNLTCFLFTITTQGKTINDLLFIDVFWPHGIMTSRLDCFIYFIYICSKLKASYLYVLKKIYRVIHN